MFLFFFIFIIFSHNISGLEVFVYHILKLRTFFFYPYILSQWAHQSYSLFLLKVFNFFNISFSFLEILSLCLYYSSVPAYLLLFLLKPYHINQNLKNPPAISDSSNFAFRLLVSLAIFTEQSTLCTRWKESQYGPSGLRWWVVCGGEAFYSSMVRSVFLCFWTVNFTSCWDFSFHFVPLHATGWPGSWNCM